MAFLNFRGLFESVFGKRPTSGSNLPAFRLLSSYDSSFTPFDGRAWDIATVRAAVDAWARNAARIQPRHIRSTGGRRETVSDGLERILQTRPNPYMTAYAFYYRVAAQFIVYNNAFTQSGDWINVSRELLRLIIESASGGQLRGQLIYTERYL